ncbi:methionine adenosyltransferase [Rickettsiales bacterium]|nr:methionine adenosyltransferase [Rickettsiales bacterium]
MYLFTSESVSAGHPDKIADQISDLILDYFFEQDPNARVAAESFVTPFKIVIAGEIRANFEPNYQEIEQRIRNLIKEIGYISGKFTYDKIAIEFLFNKQSADIAQGVDSSDGVSEGAGDQGIMFGYACDETEELMPASLTYSHQILRNIYQKHRNGDIIGFGPDAKSQVTLAYDDQNNIDHIDTILLSIQHQESLTKSDIINQVKPIILDIIPEKFITNKTKFLFNPTGQFIIGGPEGDVGLTGRKIIVDTYGGAAAHGGGAFSGKDYTKVDRSGAYIARFLAKNIVASSLAKKCLIQLSYAIGVSQPISIYVNSFGSATIEEKKIVELINKNIDLTPRGIRNILQLDRAIYLPTATYGHFGRKYDSSKGLFSWERIDQNIFN